MLHFKTFSSYVLHLGCKKYWYEHGLLGLSDSSGGLNFENVTLNLCYVRRFSMKLVEIFVVDPVTQCFAACSHLSGFRKYSAGTEIRCRLAAMSVSKSTETKSQRNNRDFCL